MAIHVPGRRAAFPPIGRLRASPIHGGHRSGLISLNLTPMVDMMTMLVVFLLQSFSADGQIMFVQKDLVMPPADASKPLIDRGPVVTVYDERVFVEGNEIVRAADLDASESSIKPLVELLTGIRERDEKIHPRDPTKPYDGVVIFQGDEEADFMLVRKTIASLNEAGWAKVNFTTKSVAAPEGAPAAP